MPINDPHNFTAMSTQARAFIDKAGPNVYQPVTWHNVEARRRETRAGYAAQIKSVVERYAPQIEEHVIAGIPTQRIIPGAGSQHHADAAVLYFFGGGYITGSPDEDQPITVPLAHHSGVDIFVPHYPLAPEAPYPAALDGALPLYMNLLEHYGPEHLVVAGESAGGNLALATVLRAREQGLRSPAAIALMSPWADVSNSGDSVETNAGLDPTLSPDALIASSRMFCKEHAPRDPGPSPLFAAYDHDFPPVMISTGTRDLLQSDATRLATVLRDAGVYVDFHLWEGLWHVFEFYPQLPEADASLREFAAFIRHHLP